MHKNLSIFVFFIRIRPILYSLPGGAFQNDRINLVKLLFYIDLTPFKRITYVDKAFTDINQPRISPMKSTHRIIMRKKAFEPIENIF